ncbi:MAG: sodium:proton antiporter NhaD [Cellvibrionaceae bacterium]|nr:sodium:proton antiporter NhaD [Cellvibrionaceae bacterium]
MEMVIGVIAIVALVSIALEDVFHFNKAKTTLFLGCLAWVILFMHASSHGRTEHIQEVLNENLLDIASLWLFLMATMTFVAYLNARGMVSAMVQRVVPGELTFRQLTILLGIFAMLLSTVCDNITATLVCIGVVQAFQLEPKERIRLCVILVFAVNSGGVILITGDVTTLMIFSAGHVTIGELLKLFLPAIGGVALLILLLSTGPSRKITAENATHQIEWLDVVIGSVFLSTIVATMVFNLLFDIPPVLTFLFGLSIMFMVGGIVHTFKEEIHLLQYIRQIQFETLLFFLGILLLVGALKEVGVLVWLTELYAAVDPSFSSYLMGVISSVMDNVPLTAALLKAEPQLETSEWLSLAYAVGIGGSILVIGSAAGIVAMSKVRELTFMQYARYAPHVFAAYSVGYGLTLLI